MAACCARTCVSNCLWCCLQSSLGAKLPGITPNAKCKLRLLKLERIKDWLLMEEEFVSNQERLKPQEERNEEDRTKASTCTACPLLAIATSRWQVRMQQVAGMLYKVFAEVMIACRQQLKVRLKDHSCRLMSSEDPQ